MLILMISIDKLRVISTKVKGDQTTKLLNRTVNKAAKMMAML